MNRALVLGAAVTLALQLLAPAAEAHLVSTELGPFYDGAAHPLVTPGDLLMIVALAVLAGLRGAEGGRRALLGLCCAWAAATITSFAYGQLVPLSPLATAAALVALGIAGALALSPSPALLCTLGILIGTLHGLENGAAASEADGVWLSVCGIASGVGILAILTTALCVHLERRGAKLALRVAGSWIAAIGLLLAGWQLSGIAI